jgi:hypothetical protein
MAPSSSAAVLSLLRHHKLDRTLTSVARLTPPVPAPLGYPLLDQRLLGGVPRGQLSEIVGPVSSGRTSLAWAALAAATARGEWVALIDTFDRFDPDRAAAAGLVLSRVLWVRGQALSKTHGAIDPAWIPGERSVQGPGTLLERTLDRAIKALNLVAQSGVCTMVVLDLIDAPAQALARVPRATWLRLQRVVEGTETALLLLAATPVARSAGGLSIQTGAGTHEPGSGNQEQGAGSLRMERRGVSPAGPAGTTVRWKGTHDRTRRLGGLSTRVRAASPRGYVGDLPLAIG